MSFSDKLASYSILPVITPYEVEQTVRTCEALLAGGMQAVELTLRTPSAVDSLRAVKQRIPELVVAAGTVIDVATVTAATDAGADFCVSPGISREMIEACSDAAVPFLPGVATPSDVVLGLSCGITVFKLFPAVAVGGIPLLKSLAGPFPNVRFCPTGGLNRNNFRDFLELPNVICCGGSWMVAEELVSAGNWADIEKLAGAALHPETT